MKVSGPQRNGGSVFDLDEEMGWGWENAIETRCVGQGVPATGLSKGKRRCAVEEGLPYNLTDLDGAGLVN